MCGMMNPSVPQSPPPSDGGAVRGATVSFVLVFFQPGTVEGASAEGRRWTFVNQENMQLLLRHTDVTITNMFECFSAAELEFSFFFVVVF